MSSFDVLTSLQISKWIISLGSLPPLGFFLYNLVRLPKKGFDSYVLLLVTGSTIMYYLLGVISLMFLDSDGAAIMLGGGEISVYNFILYWTTSISVLTYLVVKAKKTFLFRHWATGTFIASVSLALFYTSLLLFNVGSAQLVWGGAKGIFEVNSPLDDFKNGFIHIVVYQLLFFVLPVVTTIYCYVAVDFDVKKNGLNSLKTLQLDTSRVIYCALLQLVCFTPKIIVDITVENENLANDVVRLLSFIVFDLWGVLNVVAYWLVRTSDREIEKEGVDLGGLSNQSSGMAASFVLTPDRV